MLQSGQLIDMSINYTEYGFNPDSVNRAIDATNNPPGVREKLGLLHDAAASRPRPFYREYSPDSLKTVIFPRLVEPVQRYFDTLRPYAADLADPAWAFGASLANHRALVYAMGRAAEHNPELYLSAAFVKQVASMVAHSINPVNMRRHGDFSGLDLTTLVRREALKGEFEGSDREDPNVHLLEAVRFGDPFYVNLRRVGRSDELVAGHALVMDFFMCPSGVEPGRLDPVACAAFLDGQPETSVRYTHLPLEDCRTRKPFPAPRLQYVL